MARPRSKRTHEIEDFALNNVEQNGRSLGQAIANKFQVSTQAANRHLNRLADMGLLIREGTTRNVEWKAVAIMTRSWEFELKPDLEEDAVYRITLAPILKHDRENVREIAIYAVTEMINNAIDHSLGTNLELSVFLDSASITIRIADDGIGIFRKITEALDLTDYRLALLELAKGKFTTDPARHSGEGLFFTSKLVDEFTLFANELRFMSGDRGEWLFEQEVDANSDTGTRVWLKILRRSEKQMSELFAHFSAQEDQVTFDKTIVPVKLARIGEENLVSRSQAKRILARIDKFKEIVLDFGEVHSIGQAFADEIFRVFANSHPEIHLYHIKAEPNVRKMIDRAKSNQLDAPDLQTKLPLT